MRKTIIIVIIMLIIGGGIVGFYYFQKTRTDAPEEKEMMKDEMTLILEKDLEKDYPITPKEVVKFHSSILKSLYSTTTDEEVEVLGKKMREMLDEDVLNKNPLEDHMFDLKMEVAAYRERTKEIQSFKVDPESLETDKKEDGEYATINVMYRIREKGKAHRLTEKYILRKDSEGKWKVMGWKVEDTQTKKSDE